ncbi:MAG: dihydroneopterin aldolase [SAR324 cluster bacterium]|nr:dihydroneopterin aldolase [SAR324 cluster bacterium]
MRIKIIDLRLRTIIGMNDSERTKLQDVIINVEIDFDGKRVAQSDSIEDTVNYRTITKRIIKEVEQSQFFMLEKLASHILSIVMEDPKVEYAQVELGKPHSVRFADSVSIVTSERRS